MSEESLRSMVGELYSSIRYDLPTAMRMRKDKLSTLREDEQLFIVGDRTMCSLRDRSGMGPLNELSREGIGKVAVQIRIFEQRAKFDGPEFASKWGTPIDTLIGEGCIEVQWRARGLGLVELTRLRPSGKSFLHILAGKVRDEDYLDLLSLPKDALMAQDRNGDSALRIMYQNATPRMKSIISDRHPGWTMDGKAMEVDKKQLERNRKALRL
jgi:hypothetical protein